MTHGTEAPDLFSPYHDGSMQHDKDGGWVFIDDYNALSDAKDARIAELEAERDALVSRCRMVVSHATAGKTDGVGMSINDVCVQITALRNVLWNSAKKAGAEAAEAKLTDCDPYLKDHETPGQRLESNHKEALSLMKLLEQEKRHSEVWVKAARVAEAKLAKAETVQHAASVILADRWGGYGNQRARQAMWDFVYKEHNRHMLPMSHYDGVLQAGLRALAELTTTPTERETP